MTRRIQRRSWREPKRRLVAAEADTLRAIVQYLELHQFCFVRHHPIRPASRDGKTFMIPIPDSQKGAPDLIVLREYRPVCIEVKAKGKKLSMDQERFKERATSAGCLWVTAYDVEAVMIALPPREHQIWPVPDGPEREALAAIQVEVEGR